MSRVVLIVAGGIAAYKAPDLVRKLIAVGCEVQVVMTDAAAAFCTELSLATVSDRAVRRSLLDASEEGHVGHIEIADWAQLVLVAPATADILARAAAGIANDLATTVLLATRAPVLWAPAMNTNMWRHPATQQNLETLRARGAGFVGPDHGELACGWIGEGRMIDPPIIAAAARAVLDGRPHEHVWPADVRGLAGTTRTDWTGLELLVTAGPTRAYLDPVRFISNASTGVMGFSLAAVAAERGANVSLVTGPVSIPTPAGVRRVDVETGAQMLAACEQQFEAGRVDLVAMVAAVADLIPVEPASGKVPKEQVLDSFAAIRWRTEVDILATLVERHPSTKFLGFGAQTIDASKSGVEVELELRRLGTQKLARKRCHALFVNRVGVPGLGFASSTNAGSLLFAGGPEVEVVDAGKAPKRELAGWILDQLRARWWPEVTRS